MNETTRKPTGLDALNIEAGLKVAAQGGKVKDIAEALGCGIDRYHIFKRNYPDFAQRLKQAREQGYETLADNMLTIHEDHPSADWNELRLRFETTKWYLSKMHAAVFGDKLALSVEHVDIREAMEAARSRVPRIINPTPDHVFLPPMLDPLE